MGVGCGTDEPSGQKKAGPPQAMGPEEEALSLSLSLLLWKEVAAGQ